MRRALFAIWLTMSVVLTACAGAPQAVDDPREVTTASSSEASATQPRLVTAEARRPTMTDLSEADFQAAGTAMTSFAAAVWRALPEGGDLVVSPYSLYAILGMAEAGSTGETQAALEAALGVDPGSTMTTVDAVLSQLTTGPRAQQPGAVTVEPANSLWAQDGLSLKPSFLDRLAREYGAGVFMTDYAGDPEGSRRAVNGWVAQRTRDLIPELLKTLDPHTQLTLVNALYFQATWQTQFSKLPEPMVFATPDGPRPVPAFGATFGGPSATGDGWRSVSLPYGDGMTTMTLIIPDPGRFDEVSRAFGPEMLTAATADGDSKVITFAMPAFDVTSDLDLTGPMRNIGLGGLFETGLSEMVDGAVLQATDIIHHAVIRVDENGTTAAAASAMMIAGSAAPTEYVTLTVDRPFFFIIHDITTQAPLFLGRVVDPRT